VRMVNAMRHSNSENDTIHSGRLPARGSVMNGQVNDFFSEVNLKKLRFRAPAACVLPNPLRRKQKGAKKFFVKPNGIEVSR
jgi:hypothetical protein